jgi:hypothetical protein
MSVKKGELKHIRIEPDTAKGSKGVHVTISKHISDGKNKGPWLRNEDEETKSHATPELAAAHVKQTLHEHFGSAAAVGKSNPNDGGASMREPLPNAGKTKASVSHPTSDDGPNPSSDSWG